MTGANLSWEAYGLLNNQPMASLNMDGTWTDYIYANGQKIARVSSADSRVHTQGVFTTDMNELRWNLPVPQNPGGGNYTVKAGDRLCFRQYNSTPGAARRCGSPTAS